MAGREQANSRETGQLLCMAARQMRAAQRTPSAGDECLDPPMSRLLMKKTWCHGQLIASAQGIAYGVRAISANVTNSGSITAASSAGGASFGVWSYNTAVTNSGTVSATNSAGGEASGLHGEFNATVSNDPASTIAASTNGSNAWGVHSFQTTTVSSNGGTISATTNGAGSAYGVAAESFSACEGHDACA